MRTVRCYTSGQLDTVVEAVRTDVRRITTEIGKRLKEFEVAATELRSVVESDMGSLTAGQCTQFAMIAEDKRQAFVATYNALAQVRVSDETGQLAGHLYFGLERLRPMLREEAEMMRYAEQEVVEQRVKEREGEEDAAFAADLRERVAQGEYIDVDEAIRLRRRRRKNGEAIPPYEYKFVTPPQAVMPA